MAVARPTPRALEDPVRGYLRELASVAGWRRADPPASRRAKLARKQAGPVPGERGAIRVPRHG